MTDIEKLESVLTQERAAKMHESERAFNLMRQVEDLTEKLNTAMHVNAALHDKVLDAQQAQACAEQELSKWKMTDEDVQAARLRLEALEGAQ